MIINNHMLNPWTQKRSPSQLAAAFQPRLEGLWCLGRSSSGSPTRPTSTRLKPIFKFSHVVFTMCVLFFLVLNCNCWTKHWSFVWLKTSCHLVPGKHYDKTEVGEKLGDLCLFFGVGKKMARWSQVMSSCCESWIPHAARKTGGFFVGRSSADHPRRSNSSVWEEFQAMWVSSCIIY